MPMYSVKHLKTGEQKEMTMTISQYEEWRKDNPDWDKDWMAGVASAVSGVGDYQNKLPQGFKDRLNNVKKHHPYAKFDKI
tara:strand:+ start:3042 stop:3281 length:240 start_codon:yes stop_codon:yes gene_type:complete